MEESNKTICKTCRIIKIRTLDGKFPDNVNKRWVDETGSLWNGKNCPKCHRDSMKLKIKNKRNIEKLK